MSKLLQNAAKGQRKAMEELYERNKQKLFYIADSLLCSEALGENALNGVFKNIGGKMTEMKEWKEEDFSSFLIRKTADYCKNGIAKNDPKAFRMPQNRNFAVFTFSSCDGEKNTARKQILAGLPPLQRFIYVLGHIGGWDEKELASFFRTDEKTMALAREAEMGNIERLIKTFNGTSSYESITEELLIYEKMVTVPVSLDASVRRSIDKIAAPIERKNKKRIRLCGVSALSLVLLIGIAFLIPFHQGEDVEEDNILDETVVLDDVGTEEENDFISSPVIELDADTVYFADIEIENYGTVTVELDQNAAPVTVANFIYLAESGFYDGLTFHRIIDGFMMQGGDPNGDGTGGSDTCIVGEFSDNGYENNLSHTRGAVSMARASDYNSASSQFFIVQEDSSFSLDGQYAVFGYVTEGIEIVDTICETAEPTDSNGTIESSDQPVIVSVTIRTE